MKKITLLFAAATALFVSCNQDELKKLNDDNASLNKDVNYKDSTISEMLKSFNDIEGNLMSIREKEKNVKLQSSTGNGEVKADIKERIQEDIAAINQLLENNKKAMDGMRSKLKKSGLKMDELNKMIENLNQRLADKDIEIGDLKQQLANLNIKIEGLNANVNDLSKSNEAKAQVIDQQTQSMNTAYYIVGTQKELKEKGVISKEGGFIGIGRSAKLKQDFDNSLFTKVDITKFNNINIGGKKVNIITTHDAKSYSVEGDKKKTDRIVITNAESFWKVSKYLVVVID